MSSKLLFQGGMGRTRVRISRKKAIVLENEYIKAQYLSDSLVEKLCEELNMTRHMIRRWFCNRRSIQKRRGSCKRHI